MKYTLLTLVVLVSLFSSACETTTSQRESPSLSEGESSPLGPAQLLPGGRWDLTSGRTVRGEPFELTLVRTRVEALNTTDQALNPVCVLQYGSQTGVVETDLQLEPGERRMVSGTVTFPRPLDDYESSGAACYTRLPADLERELERGQETLDVGRATKVPRLVGERLDATLPSFRRGLLIDITDERTPCTAARLTKLSVEFNPFGKPPCGNPFIVSQRPEPGTVTMVGEVISVSVASRP